MRMELTPRSVDLIATKEAFLSFAVGAGAVALILAIGGARTAAGILAGALVFSALFVWMQKHIPARKTKWRIVIGRPTAGRS